MDEQALKFLKGAIGAAGLTAGSMGDPATLLPRLAWGFLACLIVDGITGVIAAAVFGRASSAEARNRLFAKGGQYFALLALSGIVSYTTGSPAMLTGMLLALSGVEVMSILENVMRLQSKGVNLGPIAPLIQRLRRYFAVAQDLDEPPARGPRRRRSTVARTDPREDEPSEDTAP